MSQRREVSRCPVCESDAPFYCKKCEASFFFCPTCHTIFQDPMPTTREMVDFVDEEYNHGRYAQYEQARDFKIATFRSRIARIRSRAAGNDLLDLGCSCGYFMQVALEAKFSVRGVEFSSAAIAAAPEEIRAEIVQGDVNDLASLNLGTYDVVSAFDIIEHSTNPLLLLMDIRKLLKPGGLLVISTPDTGHLLRPLMRKRWPMLEPLQHTVLFSRESLRMSLEKSGFGEIEISAGRKVLSADYLMGQISAYNSSIVRAYQTFARIVPAVLRRAPVSVGIGETLALARKTA